MLGVVQRMADPGSLALLKTAENADRLGALAPFTRDLAPLPGASATAYVCRDFACRRPITDAAELQDQLVRGDLDGG
jgi:hypothetical protein